MAEFTDDRKVLFLAELATTGIVKRAAQAAGINRDTAYKHRDSDTTFRELWDAALQDATDLLEEEARRRAYLGVDEPVYQGGKLVGHVQRYSDTLLLALLKAHRPAQFRDKNVKHEHSGTVKIDLEARLRKAHEQLQSLRNPEDGHDPAA